MMRVVALHASRSHIIDELCTTTKKRACLVLGLLIRALLEQQLGHVNTASECREVQRGHQILCDGGQKFVVAGGAVTTTTRTKAFHLSFKAG